MTLTRNDRSESWHTDQVILGLSAEHQTKRIAVGICKGMGHCPPDLVCLFLIDLAKKNLKESKYIDLTLVDWHEVCLFFDRR